MAQKKIKHLRPQLLEGDTRLEAQILNDRILRQELTRNRLGLNATPEPLAEEAQLVRGFATVLNQCISPLLIQHPLHPLQLVINKTVGAKVGYILSCGDYMQQFLEMIHIYINKGDNVLNLGAGLGIAASFAGVRSGQPVTALEPNKSLHSVIQQNADLNGVQIHLLEGCITPENNQNVTEFHVMQDYLSSSLFMHSGQVDFTIKSKPVLFQELLSKSQADALVVDIVGAEISLFEEVNLKQLNKVILTIHTPIIGEKSTAYIINQLSKNGLGLKDIKGASFVFIRDKN